MTTRLINPAAVSTSEAIIKGHFLPRKSKFVFLNISIKAASPAKAYERQYGATSGEGTTNAFIETLYKSLLAAK